MPVLNSYEIELEWYYFANNFRTNNMLMKQNVTGIPEFAAETTATLQDYGDRPLYTLTLSQFEALVKHWFIQAQSTVMNDASSDSRQYFTRKEAAAMLYISLPTLHRYTKLGIISCKRIGTRILYSQSDLDEACKVINNKNHENR